MKSANLLVHSANLLTLSTYFVWNNSGISIFHWHLNWEKDGYSSQQSLKKLQLLFIGTRVFKHLVHKLTAISYSYEQKKLKFAYDTQKNKTNPKLSMRVTMTGPAGRAPVREPFVAHSWFIQSILKLASILFLMTQFVCGSLWLQRELFLICHG